MNGLQFRFALVFALGPLTASGSTAVPQPGQFRADASVVLIGATVLDTHDRLVRGLTRQDFRLFDDKIEQTIRYFGEEDVPLSLAVVFDTSGSMAGKLAGMRGALSAVMETSNPEDEFCLIAFAERPELVVPWTADAAEVQNRILSRPAHGRTALLDAIEAGLRQLRQSHNPRAAPWWSSPMEAITSAVSRSGCWRMNWKKPMCSFMPSTRPRSSPFRIARWKRWRGRTCLPNCAATPPDGTFR
jgi:hypothetical protein